MNMTSTAADADEKIVIKEDDESAIQKIESSKVIRTAGKVAEKKTSKIEADDREKIETKGSEITMQKIEIPKVIPTGKVMEKKGGKPSALRKRKEKKEERNEQTRGTEIIEGSGMQSTGNQKHGQSFGQIIKLNILKRYEFKDLLEFNTLNMHYKELMKDIDNLEQRRFMDVLIFAFEIGQRLKALEIHTKLNGNEIELEKIRNEVDVIKINEFDDINELEKYLYNLLMRIEFAKMPIKNVEKNKIVDNIKKIKKMRKNLHAFRFAWIIQKWKEEESKNKNRGEEAENKDIKGILNALNLEEGTKFNEQIQIWKTILGQIKLDHKLYIERGIKTEKGKEIFDLAEYSQQLYFDNRDNKYENDLAENLIKGLEFVDIKDINRGEPIKYEWMKKYMKAKESVTKLVEEWHSFAKILFNGSYLVGTINSNSNLDIIILTYNLKIDDKQVAECIIEEKFDEHKKMQRERICKNDKLFLCQLCKESNVISAVKINSSLELVEAIICEDDDYESKSFDKCKFKMKVEFLFIILPVPDKPKKPVQIENNKTSFLLMRDENPLPDDYYLQILTSKEVKSDEIDQILVELYKLPERKKNFFSLLGFRDNIRMLELMPTADGKNFRIACAALKLWAKRNNIYASKVGFFKGFNMNILMVKIYLLYPTASVSFLIEQFLATYIVWPWPMPVQLQEITKLTYDRIAENPLWYDMDPNAVMPIISPGFIESNKASNVDQNTKIIINTIMSEGLKQIREIRAGNMGWSDFMRGHDLGKKYQHFLVVNCLTKIKKGSFGNDFCAIASLKIRDFIPNVIGKILPQEIDWYHIIEAGSRKKCFINREGYSDISNYKCDLWLVGLKPKKDNQIKWNELINLENSMNEASKTMYKDYFEFKQKKSNNRFGKKEKESLERNLLLITNYVKKEDLRKWNIQLRGWEIILN